MGLRCLLGHDFGAPETERERQEEGNEVVVTVREMKTCERCGERQIISENKEVTSILTPEEVGLAEEDEEPSHPAVSEETAAATDGEELEDLTAEEDDGVILENEPERRPGEWPPADVPEASEAADDPATADGNDAETTSSDDGSDRDGSGNGKSVEAADDEIDRSDDGGVEVIDGDDGAVPWPEHEEAPPRRSGGDPTPWPEIEGEDEGFSAQQDDGERVELSFSGGGLTPVRSGEFADGAEVLEPESADEPDDEDVEFVRAPATESQKSPGARTEFYCPNCGLVRPAGESSMRVGDICPSCRRGYIAERKA